jgi:hypothetical protein
VKRNRGEEPFGVVIRVCMEISQGDSLCSYLYFKLAKTSCFSFYLLSFCFYKIEQEAEQVLGGGDWQQWKGGGGGERR